MSKIHSNILFSLSICSAFSLKVARLPDALIGFVVALMIAGAVLAHLMLIRTTGIEIGVGGLILVFHSAPEPSAILVGLLVYLAVLQITATILLISADLSAAKEKRSLEL
jgi:hypothetical protein